MLVLRIGFGIKPLTRLNFFWYRSTQISVIIVLLWIDMRQPVLIVTGWATSGWRSSGVTGSVPLVRLDMSL